MAILKSKFKYMLDEAASITFRSRSAAAITADGVAGTIVLDDLNGYWNNNNELADQTFAIAINIATLELGDDEEYELNLEFGDDASFTNSIITHTLPVTGEGKQLVMLVDMDTVQSELPTATRMRINVDVTASSGSPSITFDAFIAGAIIR